MNIEEAKKLVEKINEKHFKEILPDTVFWYPEELEEQIVGVVIELVDSEYGIGVVLLGRDNIKYVTPSHTVLQERLAKVSPGDVLRITYKGQKPSAKGNTNIYKVEKHEGTTTDNNSNMDSA